MEREAQRRVEGSHPQETRKLSQETKAILAGATSIIVLLLGLLVTSVLTSARIEARIDQVQAEARSDREAWQAEGRSDRAAWQAEARAVRAEVRADREDFQRQILRLTEAQVRTAAVVEQMQATSR